MKRLSVFVTLIAAAAALWLAGRPTPPSPGLAATGSSVPAGDVGTGTPSGMGQAPEVQQTSLEADPRGATADAPDPSLPEASQPPLPPWVGPRPRLPWDPAWMQQFAGREAPLPARFPLPGGAEAVGEVLEVMDTATGVEWISGRLDAPEPGSFFFRRQSIPGIAGTHVGVVQFPETGRAHRLEPSSQDGSPELVARQLDEVVCVAYVPAASAPAPAAGSAEPGPEGAPLVDIGQHPNIPIPDYQNGVPVLESLPGARGVAYLDFDGETTSQWNGRLIVARRANFSAGQIREIWRHVAADYTSFNINVTTDLRVFERAAENGRIRVIITPTTDAGPGTGGVAFIGSWNWTGDTPCWAFGTTVKDAAEQIAHEVGHTLGLGHDGRQPPGRDREEYYGGHGSGEVGWAPIMGVAYGQPVTQWSRGEYANASNREDDLRVITTSNTSVAYRVDDHGGTFAAASFLEIFDGGTVTNRGIIERNTDVDAFRFSTLGGQLNLTARPAGVAPNLAIRLELTDTADTLILASSPANTLRASFNTNLPPGEYVLRVRGAGRGANATSGFTTYGSLGFYQVTGTVQGGVTPVRFRIPENSPVGTVVGDLNRHANHPDPRHFEATGGSGLGVFRVAPDGEVTVLDATRLDFEVREQFDLLVDIRYPGNPALDEPGRRVVVHVDDVNEMPVVSSGPCASTAGRAREHWWARSRLPTPICTRGSGLASSRESMPTPSGSTGPAKSVCCGISLPVLKRSRSGYRPGTPASRR